MKGKNVFTTKEIAELRVLITKRQHASRDEQKKIRHRMRAIGFYGQDDWGIHDCQLSDLDALIKNEQIIVVDSKIGSILDITPIEQSKFEVHTRVTK